MKMVNISQDMHSEIIKGETPVSGMVQENTIVKFPFSCFVEDVLKNVDDLDINDYINAEGYLGFIASNNSVRLEVLNEGVLKLLYFEKPSLDGLVLKNILPTDDKEVKDYIMKFVVSINDGSLAEEFDEDFGITPATSNDENDEEEEFLKQYVKDYVN